MLIRELTHKVSNKELMGTFRKILNVPFGIDTPAFLLKMGAVIIGTETELILKSRWISPEILQTHGFQWRFSGIENCLTDILKN